MGLMDNMKGKAKDMMDDPDKKKEIEQMAKEKGISVEQAAKEHLAQHETE